MKITFLVGISASGKSTRAKQLEKEGALVVSRDRLREYYYPNNGVKRVLHQHQEKYITKREEYMVAQCIKLQKDVVIDDTNLRTKYITRWIGFAEACRKKFQQPVIYAYELMTDSNNIDLCIARNKARFDSVPEEVIQKQARYWRSNKVDIQEILDNPTKYADKVELESIPMVVPFWVEPYKPNPTKPQVLLCDIDGTVAKATFRNVYDTDGLETDEPRPEVIQVIEAVAKTGVQIIFMSGRSAVGREKTEAWIQKYINLPYKPLVYMREVVDIRSDEIVKYELFNQFIRNYYNVLGWFDDRHRVSVLVEELEVPLFFVGKLNNKF